MNTPSDKQTATWAVEQHAARWNAQDRTAWLDLFDDEVTFEDPVGKTPKLGRAAAEGSWDNSFTSGRVWTLHPQRIVPGANEAAVIMLNRGNLQGKDVELQSIEIYKVNEAGKIVSVRAFFEQPTEFELNPFFVPE